MNSLSLALIKCIITRHYESSAKKCIEKRTVDAFGRLSATAQTDEYLKHTVQYRYGVQNINRKTGAGV